MKLHLCCGDVYLDGWHNVDILGKAVAFGEDNPNKTTVDNYYSRPYDLENKQREILIDQRVNLTDTWDIAANSCDRVLFVSTIEHFTVPEAQHVVKEAHRVLKNGGLFQFDFPDIYKAVDVYKNNPDELMRLIYCSHKNEYSIHKWGYTNDTALRLLLCCDWKDVQFGEIVSHDYPMLGVTAYK